MRDIAPAQPLPMGEFVPLMAMIVSLGALSIDAMLPALLPIASDLGAADPKDGQLIISMMFLGFAIGQLIYGPLSDAVGRKRAIYMGLGLFLAGCVLSVSASTFAWMVAGRVLQGVGAAATRIVTMALIRDQYAGEAMAKVMSLIMGVFVLVPAIAPALGQAVMMATHWRMIFGLLALQAIVSVLWLGLRQPETLPAAKRREFTIAGLGADVREVFSYRETVGYTAGSAFVFANLVGYLTTAPLLFRDLFGIVETFPLYFSVTAVAIGVGSVVNSRLVQRFGARAVSLIVLRGLLLWSLGFSAVASMSAGQPPLWQLMIYLVGAFFCMGPLMGNLNALAMGPVGHIAGTAAAVVGASSTFISLGIGSVIGRAYAETVYPMLLGFCVLSASAWLVVRGVKRARAAA